MSVTTLDFAGAIELLKQGKAITRLIWPHSRILVKDNELVIQHDVTMPGVTPWRFTFADMTSCDYVEAFFNHRGYHGTYSESYSISYSKRPNPFVEQQLTSGSIYS